MSRRIGAFESALASLVGMAVGSGSSGAGKTEQAMIRARENQENMAVEYFENKDAMDYAWGEACSQPETIKSYNTRRGE